MGDDRALSRDAHVIVTAHQPNFLPSTSIIRKCLNADAVIWLDEVQYTPGGWTNRNRMPDGSWLTVPVETGAGFQKMNRVRLSDHRRWRHRAVKTLQQQYAGAPWLGYLCPVLERPHRLLVGLNVALLHEVFRAYGVAPEFLFQSHLDGGHAVQAVSDDADELLPISERLAMMVAEAGGTTYLAGPSARNYMSEEPFAALGIQVDYWTGGSNDCVLTDLARRRTRAMRVAL